MLAKGTRLTAPFVRAMSPKDGVVHAIVQTEDRFASGKTLCKKRTLIADPGPLRFQKGLAGGCDDCLQVVVAARASATVQRKAGRSVRRAQHAAIEKVAVEKSAKPVVKKAAAKKSTAKPKPTAKLAKVVSIKSTPASRRKVAAKAAVKATAVKATASSAKV